MQQPSTSESKSQVASLKLPTILHQSVNKTVLLSNCNSGVVVHTAAGVVPYNCCIMSRRHAHAQSRRNNNGNSNSSSTCSNSHLIGTSVSVVQKQDQGTGRLTSGTIAEILTNSSFHPRGIKVRLEDGTVGRISSSSNTSTSPTFDNYHAGHGHGHHYDYEYDDAGNDGPAAARLGHTTTLADFVTMPKTNKASSLPTQNSLHVYEYEHEDEFVGQNEDAHADWACPVCTFANSGLLPECEMCQTRRVT